MNVTQVRIVDPDPNSRDCLLAYASVVLEGELVIKDMKLIRRTSGEIIVDFPSTPLKDHCGGCGRSVECTAHYCPRCGTAREPWRAADQQTGNGDQRRSIFTNVVHPTNNGTRRDIERAVIEAWKRHKSATGQPGTIEDFGGETP